MDESSFDRITRTFATSRRRALKLALGALAAGLAGPAAGTSAARRGFPGPPNPFERPGCTIAGTTYPANTTEPGNPCHLCDPALDRSNWSPNAGGFCGDGSQVCCDGECCLATHCCGLNETCTPCRCEIDGELIEDGVFATPQGCLVCDPAQSTAGWSPLIDQSTCGGVSGRVCCNGECCSPSECCNGVSCEECGPHCHIDGQDIPAGDTKPGKNCEVCKPELAFGAWSPADDGASCNDGGGSCCTAGVCGACSCIIDGEPVRNGDPNPRNDCEQCNYFQNPDDWSNRGNRAPCEDGRECCDGKCCPANQCCSVDGCEPCCRIGPLRVDDGDVNTSNTCQTCDASRDGHDWTPVRDGEVCGANDNSECCNGECCPNGQCCKNGACGRCDCVIGGVHVAPDEINRANPCEICTPELSRSDWSAVSAGTSCDAQGGTCCGRACCASDLCCLLDACGDCLCSIDNVIYPPKMPHPTVDCLECNPQADPFAWSTSADRTACGDGAQQCCGGACCDPGLCCVAGACRTCGCFIDGVEFRSGESNPANDCQFCNPDTATDAWTSVVDGNLCGETAAQCCRAGACTICGCLIGGEGFIDGQQNPGNECQYCDHALDPSGWSPRNEISSCDTGGDGVCCNGSCCPSGFVCNLDDTCTPPGCLIDGQHVAANSHNPLNDCQICFPDESETAWSVLGEGAACGDTGAQCCVAGICQNCGCLIEGFPRTDGEANPANECQQCDHALDPSGWSNRGETFACGAAGDGVCCDGICCPAGNVCNLDGTCTPPGCLIDGQDIRSGEPNPGNDCQFCDPDTATDAWTPVEDGNLCGETAAQCCQAGACESCGCLIGGEGFIDGEPNPENECQQCDHALDPGNWSPRNETFACGLGGDQICCNGLCCATGNCCNLDDICEPCRCEIDGVTREALEFAPDNHCLVCEPASSTTAWTFGPDYSVCSDPTAEVNRFCCQGICCEEHECCRSDGTCGPCTCVIEGAGEFEEGDRNPANDCQACNPTVDRTGWQTLPDGDICGPNLDQTCCAGQCGCPTGCFIDGVNYEDGTIRPRERCDICDAANNPTDWTPRFIPDCAPPCSIGGVIMRYGTINPDNPCQMCDGGEDWSPSDALFCGDGTQVCCNGDCCDAGACCNDAGVCAFDACVLQGCVIDGVQYEDGTVNPVNDCQVCELFTSSTAWTPRFGHCGENADRFCCDGICCDLGACCNNNQVCDFDTCQTCAIDGVLYFPEDRNPANTCQMCISNQNKFAWTTLPDNFFCDEMQLTLCCNGSCCNPGESCIGGGCQPN